MPRRSWYLLVHQLPPEPLYLRAKIRQRLSKVGAVAVKDSVYALPAQEDCLEDFEWIAEEARSGGGEAWLCEGTFLDRETDSALVRGSRAERDRDYAALARDLANGARKAESRARLARGLERLEAIARIDYFRASGRKTAESAIEKLRKRLERSSTMKDSDGKKTKNLVGRKWVTRRGVKVDRISSAWFVRRFVDPKAPFRFIDPKAEKPRAGEIAFDMAGGEFTHEGDRCTLETLVRRSGVEDRALKPIVEIVHDLDVKDGKFGRAETAGVQRVLEGIFLETDDRARLERGFALFDDLYGSFGGRRLAG